MLRGGGNQLINKIFVWHQNIRDRVDEIQIVSRDKDEQCCTWKETEILSVFCSRGKFSAENGNKVKKAVLVTCGYRYDCHNFHLATLHSTKLVIVEKSKQSKEHERHHEKNNRNK